MLRHPHRRNTVARVHDTCRVRRVPIAVRNDDINARPSAAKQYAASVMAVAAVTRGNDLQARAWVVWDEGAYAWLGITESSPADLRELWVLNSPPDFRNSVKVRFTPMTKPLPKGYRLTDCPHALPTNDRRGWCAGSGRGGAAHFFDAAGQSGPLT